MLVEYINFCFARRRKNHWRMQFVLTSASADNSVIICVHCVVLKH